METLTHALIETGLSSREALELAQDLKNLSAEECWQKLTQKVLNSKLPFSIHQLLYKAIYPQWEQQPSPAWFPEASSIPKTHIAQLMQEQGFTTYAMLHRWSVEDYPAFWQQVASLLNIQWDTPYSTVVDISQGLEKPKWFPRAHLNITHSCFQASPKAIAIISQSEQGKITKTTYEALDKLSNQIANGLHNLMQKGEKAAIIMPMTREAVAIFLGVIKAGGVVVAIPDSFSAEEIAVRLRISAAKLVFCQDQIIRDGKNLPLYQRILDAKATQTIVVPADKKLSVTLRSTDLVWDHFLSSDEAFSPISSEPQDPITILFSSGTTGEPKAIPWNQVTPLKCGSDAYFHHNLQPNDVFCWPSNLGWMMGPWLIFACLLNKATLALYEGAPHGRAFGQCVQDLKVTHLGVVPTMVRSWRNTACMENLQWNTIKLFTSTGERSNIEDMLYLMSLANYRPVIEYCGGTEVAGAYLTGTLVQPAAPAAFTTPTLGLDFVLLDEEGCLSDEGEVALIPPSLGLSTTLLNKDHHEVYYANMPSLPDGRRLRRHGDQIKRYANGFYRLLGRVDDTMKLSGIKVGSAEIETILNTLPGVHETAAVAINPPAGGPSKLIIFMVPKPQEVLDISLLKQQMQKALKERLNPLFKIHEVISIPALPRTASNKVMRRILRENYLK